MKPKSRPKALEVSGKIGKNNGSRRDARLGFQQRTHDASDVIPASVLLLQAILTIALYPIFAGLAHVALGLRRPAQGEVDALGHRL